MARKKKVKPPLVAPFQIPTSETWYVSMSFWELSEYRRDRNNPEIKIRSRLFYKGDDVPHNMWCLPVPPDMETLYDWVGQLVTQTHNARVGVLQLDNTSNEDYDVFLDPEPQYGLVFEDYNDMLLFKLGMRL